MPHLVTADAGHVVNIASVAGLMAVPFRSAYCASKHAVVAISETLRAELAAIKLPIEVTVACPAYVCTPLAEGMSTRMTSTIMEPEAAAERILAAVDTHRFYALTHGDVEDRVRRRTEGILAALDDR